MATHCTRKPIELVMLDRDGVLNHDSSAYVKSAAEWRPLPGALAAAARMRSAGSHVALCTNQSGIGRKLFTQADLASIHRKLSAELTACGGQLDLIRYCPHLPDDRCLCRKPAPGMLLDCLAEFSVSPERACFVGDSLSDMQAAIAAGCEPVLVLTGNGQACAEKAQSLGVQNILPDLAAVATMLLAGNSTTLTLAH